MNRGYLYEVASVDTFLRKNRIGERDVESQYDCFGARYYDAKVGRFLSVDPHASFYPGLTPYCYTGNNPINFIDPTGMDRASQALFHQMTSGLPLSSNQLFGAMSIYGVTGEDKPTDSSQPSDAESQGGAYKATNAWELMRYLLELESLRKKGVDIKKRMNQIPPQTRIQTVEDLKLADAQMAELKAMAKQLGSANVLEILKMYEDKMRRIKLYEQVADNPIALPFGVYTEWQTFLNFAAGKLGTPIENLGGFQIEEKK